MEYHGIAWAVNGTKCLEIGKPRPGGGLERAASLGFSGKRQVTACRGARSVSRRASGFSPSLDADRDHAGIGDCRGFMGIFSRITAAMADGAGRVGTAVSGLRGLMASLAQGKERREVAFTIAMIALSAKMAKADGVVTRSEIDAFCDLFEIPPGEEKNVGRVYNLAKREVAGFEAYASDVKRLLGDDDKMLEAVLDGLFGIAKADGAVHDRELAYLARVAELFGFDALGFSRIRARHVIEEGGDPYLVLQADPNWDYRQLRGHYRRLVRENHPDRLIARGVPEEFIRIANDRLAAINIAWEQIERTRVRA